MHATLSFYLACLLKIVKLVLCVDLVGNKCNLAVFCSSLRPLLEPSICPVISDSGNIIGEMVLQMKNFPSIF